MIHRTLTRETDAQRPPRNSYLRFSGDPAPCEVDALRDRALLVIEFTERMLVLNCAGVGAVDVRGLELLTDIHRAASERSLDVVLSEVSFELRETLVHSGLVDRSALVETRAGASLLLVPPR